jgi:hypothetical protein
MLWVSACRFGKFDEDDVRFVGYKPAAVRHCKIDWDVAVEFTAEVREALHPHDPDALRVGRLRRLFTKRPVVLGRRSRRIQLGIADREEITHEKGALVFAYSDESFFLIQADSAPASTAQRS